jgi:putative membrane protein
MVEVRKMMKVASQYFTEADCNQIALAVAEAEKHTSGEIIPVVATVSGRYDRAEDIVGMIFALVFVSTGWFLFQDILPAGSWETDFTNTVGLVSVLLMIVTGFFVGALSASLFPVLRTPFIPSGEMQSEVERRAAEVFQKFRIRKTKGSTGILIYVSLYEHMVRILGDDAISNKLSQDDWQEICDIIINGCKTNKIVSGMIDGIAKSGELLGKHFPIEEGDEDELPNELITIDSL